MEMDSYQIPTNDYPGESVSGDTTVLGQEYRAKSVDYFKAQDSGGGTVVSYATSGYRSNASQGAPDIDFDDKQGDAYESIDRFQQDRRVVATPKNEGRCPSPSSMPDLRKPGQFEMPDYVTKKGWISLRRCLCFFATLTFLTLFVAIAGVGIGVYAFLTAFEGGRILGGASQTVSDPAVAILQTQLTESQSLIEQLRADLSVQVNNFEQLSVQVASIISPANVTNETESINNGFSFDNCETSIVSCNIDRELVLAGTPSYSGCDTFPVPAEPAGKFVADIYCSVENRMAETNPISSTLDIFDGNAVCSCAVIHSTTPQASITCNLNIKTCPM